MICDAHTELTKGRRVPHVVSLQIGLAIPFRSHGTRSILIFLHQDLCPAPVVYNPDIKRKLSPETKVKTRTWDPWSFALMDWNREIFRDTSSGICALFFLCFLGTSHNKHPCHWIIQGKSSRTRKALRAHWFRDQLGCVPLVSPTSGLLNRVPRYPNG